MEKKIASWNQLSEKNFAKIGEKEIRGKSQEKQGIFFLPLMDYGKELVRDSSYKDIEAKRRSDYISYHKLFLDQNTEIIHAKIKSEKLQNNREKAQELLQVRKAQEDLNNEKNAKMMVKELKMMQEREELKRKNEENLIKKQLLTVEKIREREAVEKHSDEMKKIEGKYKEFIDGKISKFEENMKKLKKNKIPEDFRKELIERRWEESKVLNKECAERKEKEEKNARFSVVNQWKRDLNKQIKEKWVRKSGEVEESKRFQRNAVIAAKDAEFFKSLEKIKAVERQKELRSNYDAQVIYQRSQSVDKFHRNQRVGRINQEPFSGFGDIKGSFNQISNKKVRIHTSEQKSYENLIEKNKYRDLQSDVSLSNINYSKKGLENDLSRHNPITNPIGSYIPRVLPGQIARKAFQPYSKPNISEVFSYN